MSERAVEMRAVVEEWKRSGMSISSFSREKCISYYKMLYWRDKFAGNKKKKKTGGFRHLSVREENTSSGVEVKVKDVSIILSGEFDKKVLADTIRVLKEV